MTGPGLRLVEGRAKLPAGSAKLQLGSVRDPELRASMVREWLLEQDQAHQAKRWRVTVFYAPHKGAQLQQLTGAPAGLATSVSRSQSAHDLLLGHSWVQSISVPLAQIRTLAVVPR